MWWVADSRKIKTAASWPMYHLLLNDKSTRNETTPFEVFEIHEKRRQPLFYISTRWRYIGFSLGSEERYTRNTSTPRVEEEIRRRVWRRRCGGIQMADGIASLPPRNLSITFVTSIDYHHLLCVFFLLSEEWRYF